MMNYKFLLVALLSASCAAVVAACGDNAPLTNSPASIIRQEYQLTREQQILVDAIKSEASSNPNRLFTGEETTGIFDVAIALGFTIPDVETVDQSLAFANDILDRSVTVDQLSPVPTPDLLGGFAVPANELTIVDVAVLLARTIPGVESSVDIADFVNGLLGTSIVADDVLIPGELPALGFVFPEGTVAETGFAGSGFTFTPPLDASVTELTIESSAGSFPLTRQDETTFVAGLDAPFAPTTLISITGADIPVGTELVIDGVGTFVVNEDGSVSSPSPSPSPAPSASPSPEPSASPSPEPSASPSPGPVAQ